MPYKNAETANIYRKRWAEKNPEKQRGYHRAWLAKNPHKSLEYQRAWKDRDWARWAISKKRSQCKRNNIEFSISACDLEMPKYCPVLGLELNYKTAERNNDCSASIDRIDSSMGYVGGNVVVMSLRANRIKNDGTAEEHMRIANWMKK